MTTHPELSIIIVNYNVRQLLLDCIRSIIETFEGIDFEIIVVDNASSDGSVEAVTDTFPQVNVIANKSNVGFAGGNNQGYVVSTGKYILLLNPDTIVKPGALKMVLEFMKLTPDAGTACCRLLNPDGTLQKSIRVLPSITDHLLRALFLDRILYSVYRHSTYYSERPFKIDYATGAFLMVRREALDNMKLLNDDFFMYAEEKDLATRLLRRGWNTYFVPSTEIVHYGEQSAKQMPYKMFFELQKSQVKFFLCHYTGAKRVLMIWTYGFLLFTSFVSSLFFVVSSSGRQRFRIFAHVLKNYPKIVREVRHLAQPAVVKREPLKMV